MIESRNLPKMFIDIRAANILNGWQPHDLTKGEVLALLHSEISEALDAWRQWGLDDATGWDSVCHIPGTCPHKEGSHKPEGVGSELADTLIRWIDNLDMFSLSPHAIKDHGGRFGMSDRFGVAINVLHDLVSRFSIALDSYESCPLPEELPLVRRYYVTIYHYLTEMAEHFEIDLEAEYKRKLAYNLTRGYKHGGKRI